MAKETIASMAVRLGIDLSGFQKDMKEFQKTWGGLGKQLQDTGSKIGTSFTVAGGAIAAGLGFAVSKAMDFDAEMSRVGAIAGATGDDLKAMRDTALDLGASTSKSASEVAQGMELMAAKGFDANQVIAAMPGVIAAAEASGEDMALVSDTVASALNAFQMQASDASKVADVLAKSANTSAAGVGDLQFAFKYAAPIFENAGYSIEQLAAATGIMADAGMKGEQAGTTLRAAMLRLADPPKEAAAKLAALGVSVTDASGKFLPFDQIVGQLATSTANMTNAQKSAALSTIFGTEAMTGMLSLVEAGPDKFRSLTTELQNSGGASADAAAQMKDNLSGSMQELQGAVETLEISMGSALTPAIRAVADGISGIVGWFNNLSPTAQKWIAIGAAVTAGLMVLVGVLGFAAAAMGFLAAAEWAVILPIAGIIAAVVAVIAIIAALAYVIYTNWDSIKAATITVWSAIVGALQSAWNFIVGIFTAVWSIIGPIVTAGWEIITSYFTAVFETWKTILTAAWDILKTIFSTAFLAVYYIVTGQWGKIGELFRAAGEKLGAILSGAWDKIKGIWATAFDSIGKAASAGWEHIKGLFIGAWSAIKSFLAGIPGQAYDIGRNIISGMANGISSMASALADRAKAVVRSAVDAAKSFLGIHSPSKLMMEIGAYTGEGFAAGLVDSTGTVASAAHTMAAAPLSGVGEVDGPSLSARSAEAGPMTVIFELDGREIARSTFNYMGGTFRLRGAVT